MIQVLIVDDHAVVRHGLKKILSETNDIVVAGEADSGAQAIRLAKSLPLQVILLDINLPDHTGIDVLKQIRRDHPKLAVLILTMHAEDEFGVRALKAGATGYLSKQSAPEHLVAAVRQVATGHRYISPLLAEELANTVIGGDSHAPHHALSDRELQTLRLIASGHGLSEIAAMLCLSPKTVSVYRSRVLQKLNLNNNAKLVCYAIEHRLLDNQ